MQPHNVSRTSTQQIWWNHDDDDDDDDDNDGDDDGDGYSDGDEGDNDGDGDGDDDDDDNDDDDDDKQIKQEKHDQFILAADLWNNSLHIFRWKTNQPVQSLTNWQSLRQNLAHRIILIVL